MMIILMNMLMLVELAVSMAGASGAQLSLQTSIEQQTAALIVVDVQECFMPPDGALAVPHGRDVIPTINQLRTAFAHVVTTQDWHSPDHISFYTVHEDGKPMQTKRLLYTPDGQLLEPRRHGCNSKFDGVAGGGRGSSRNSSNALCGKVKQTDGMCHLKEAVGNDTVVVMQKLWPPHCIMNTAGAALLPELHTRPDDVQVKKGSNPDVDAYSAFWDAGHFHTTCIAKAGEHSIHL